MLRALNPDEPHPPLAFRVPWRVERAHDRHPLVVNAGAATLDFVRVFADCGRTSITEHWGQMLPGDNSELCLCEADLDQTIVTVAWFRPDDGEEYVWRFTI